MRTARTLLRAGGLALVVALGVPAVAPAATTVTVCASGCDYSSIQDAVNGQSSGDTINVLSGVYNENVVVNKTLTINGNQSGNDARTRSGGQESFVNNPKGAFNIQADDVVIDGFTIKDESDVTNTQGAGIVVTNVYSGYQILNNIITNNTFGVFANSSGSSNSLIQQNLFDSNNNSGSSSGNGIYADAGTEDLTIDSNKFTGNNNAGILFTDNGTDADTNKNIEVSNNNASNQSGAGFVFANASDIMVHDNKLNNIGPDGSVIVAAGNVHGMEVKDNDVENNDNSAVRVGDLFGVGENEAVEATGNTLLNNGFGVRVTDAGHTGSVEFHFNRVVGNGTGASNEDVNDDIDAENNWWGCNEGPGNAGCDSVDGDVSFDPWLVLSLSADPSSVHKKGTSDVTASLLKNSDGNEPSGNDFPDGTLIKFGAKRGTVNPSSDTTQNGEAETTFKAGKDTGKGKVKAVLDNGKTKVPIQITGG